MARSTKCPVCLKTEHVRKILWGMPSGDEKPEKFYIGGCLVGENPARYICIACDLRFGGRRDTELGL
jgi:hypothetical protein